MLHVLQGRHEYRHKGYILLYYPEHPNAWKNGLVYLHRLIVENNIGRYLTVHEIVHHKDGNPLNNSVDNLEIASQSYHVSNHKRHIKDISCVLCKNIFRPIKSRQKYCSGICAQLAARKVSRPDREVLAELVWLIPTSLLAVKFGVSDKAIAKWCNRYGVPKPPRGYWGKVKRKSGISSASRAPVLGTGGRRSVADIPDQFHVVVGVRFPAAPPE